MCKTIKHKVKFKVPPRDVYAFFTDSQKAQTFTHKKAQISRRIGGTFSMEGDFIHGIIVDLAPPFRIVQAWRRKDFPVGIFSMATFDFKQTRDGGTELTLTHRGVPKDLIPRVEKHWREKYWLPMKTRSNQI